VIVLSPGSLFPWHNEAKALDVRGGNDIQPDGNVAAGDALAIINYINSFSAGPIPEDAVIGLPFGFLDVSGGPNGQGDNQVVAGDALSVINAINAEGEGEAEGGQLSVVSGQLSDDLIQLLAADAAEQGVRRKRG
jgi:hypothetical protein